MAVMLNKLFPEIHGSIEIKGLALDSRFVSAGDLFFAYKGSQQDGRSFIASALQKGAVAIAYDPENYSLPSDLVQKYKDVVFIAVYSLQQQVSRLASCFYNEPSKGLQLIGVTGTNGKTTVTQMLAQALDALDRRCGIIGTLGYGFWQELHEAKQTTPDAVSVQSNIAFLREKGAKAVALEASSHGLDQGRLNGLVFDVAVFTNLTRDHLDYHHSLEAYGEAKATLFNWPHLKVRVINQDDAFGQMLIKRDFSSSTLTYSLNDAGADLFCKDVVFNAQGIKAQLVTHRGQGLLNSRLIGRFNLSNLLAVVGGLLALGHGLEAILAVIPTLVAPDGRMQCVGGANQPLIVVDYAHTPDALEQALLALRPHTQGQLICVFGCGGDRDKGKRPLMGAIAERLADRVVVTDDNPRGEDSSAIIENILSGMSAEAKVTVIANRQQAIEQIIIEADVQDVILLAGKGHENYQEIAGVRYTFSDLAYANKALSSRNI